MPRRINNIDFVITIVHRRLLGGDGNTTLALLIARIHNQRLRHFRLIVAKRI